MKVKMKLNYNYHINSDNLKKQRFLDMTWNKFINWLPFLRDEIRIDEADTWSVDHSISKIMLPLLEQLQRTNHGYSFVKDEDVPSRLRKRNDMTPDEKDNIDQLRYKWVVDEMIWAMKQIANDENDAPKVDSTYEFLGSNNMTEEELESFKKWRDEEIVYQKRIDNGCRLMGTYFRTLWD